jgi:hypothetical protein
MQELEGLEAAENRGEVEQPTFGAAGGFDGGGGRGVSDTRIYALGEEEAG